MGKVGAGCHKSSILSSGDFLTRYFLIRSQIRCFAHFSSVLLASSPSGEGFATRGFLSDVAYAKVFFEKIAWARLLCYISVHEKYAG